MKYSFLSVIYLFIIITGCNKYAAGSDAPFIQVHYKSGFDDELNTFNNTLTKEMVMDPDIKIDFRLNKDEQTGILKKAFEADFFSMPDTFKFVSNNGFIIREEPDSGPLILRIKTEEYDKTVVVCLPIIIETENYKKLFRLMKYIDSIIYENPNYKYLPEPRGAYL